MTEAATRFVGPATFQALTGEPVFTDQWDTRIANSMAHIELSRAADAILVAPATADFLAKVAHGLADDLLSTLCLARECPLLVAPAMNRQMWLSPATQRNVAQLAADGVAILGPDSGDQACGETGMGRMLEPPDLVAELADFLAPKPLAGRRVLLTAGRPTSRSTRCAASPTCPPGMGFAIAAPAAPRCAVTPSPGRRRSPRHAGSSESTAHGAADARRGDGRLDARPRAPMCSSRWPRSPTGRWPTPASASSRSAARTTCRSSSSCRTDILAGVAQRSMRRGASVRGRAKTSGQWPGQAGRQGRAAAGREHRPCDLRPRRQQCADRRARQRGCRALRSAQLARALVGRDRVRRRRAAEHRPHMNTIDRDGPRRRLRQLRRGA